ncbi:MAG: hypothetical protein AAFZ18_39580, partial [Myxococcota bacterium]
MTNTEEAHALREAETANQSLDRGTLRPVKRAADAVRAFAALPHDLPARLVMIGDGPERPAVEALV